MFEAPYFVRDDDTRPLPTLEVGDSDRDRTDEYNRLFTGEPRHAGVLALTVVAHLDDKDEVLVVVRDPEGNRTHPNVVSTPTQRIPARWITKLASRRELATQTEQRHTFRIDGKRWMRNKRELDYEYSGLQNPTERLLGTKFGFYPEAIWPDFRYIAALHSLTLGDSRVGVADDGADMIEKIAMLNILVAIYGDEAKARFTPQAPHYSSLSWVSPDEYRDMQDQKNLLPVFGDQAAELCIHGVCIATSRGALDDLSDLMAAS